MPLAIFNWHFLLSITSARGVTSALIISASFLWGYWYPDAARVAVITDITTRDTRMAGFSATSGVAWVVDSAVAVRAGESQICGCCRMEQSHRRCCGPSSLS